MFLSLLYYFTIGLDYSKYAKLGGVVVGAVMLWLGSYWILSKYKITLILNYFHWLLAIDVLLVLILYNNTHIITEVEVEEENLSPFYYPAPPSVSATAINPEDFQEKLSESLANLRKVPLREPTPPQEHYVEEYPEVPIEEEYQTQDQFYEEEYDDPQEEEYQCGEDEEEITLDTPNDVSGFHKNTEPQVVETEPVENIIDDGEEFDVDMDDGGMVEDADYLEIDEE